MPMHRKGFHCENRKCHIVKLRLTRNFYSKLDGLAIVVEFNFLHWHWSFNCPFRILWWFAWFWSFPNLGILSFLSGFASIVNIMLSRFTFIHVVNCDVIVRWHNRLPCPYVWLPGSLWFRCGFACPIIRLPSSLWFRCGFACPVIRLPGSLWFRCGFACRIIRLPGCLWFRAGFGCLSIWLPSSLWFGCGWLWGSCQRHVSMKVCRILRRRWVFVRRRLGWLILHLDELESHCVSWRAR